VPAPKLPAPVPSLDASHGPLLRGAALEWGGGDTRCCTGNKGDETPSPRLWGLVLGEAGEPVCGGTARHGAAWRPGTRKSGDCGHTGRVLCRGMGALQGDRRLAGRWVLCGGTDAVLGTNVLLGDGCSERGRML